MKIKSKKYVLYVYESGKGGAIAEVNEESKQIKGGAKRFTKAEQGIKVVSDILNKYMKQ